MAKIFRIATITYITVLTGVVTADLITKDLAERWLADNIYSPLPFLKLFLIYNKGAAFGIFSDLPDVIRLPILIITPILAFVITYIYSDRNGKMGLSIAMGLIGGGALGNLYDRLFLGKVRDFIHLHAGDIYWPAFNVADASITVGIIIIAGSYLIGKWG